MRKSFSLLLVSYSISHARGGGCYGPDCVSGFVLIAALLVLHLPAVGCIWYWFPRKRSEGDKFLKALPIIVFKSWMVTLFLASGVFIVSQTFNGLTFGIAGLILNGSLIGFSSEYFETKKKL